MAAEFGYQAARLCEPGSHVLVLQNPGRGSRNYLEGILAGLRRLGIQHCALEMQEIWSNNKTDPTGLVRRLSQILVQHRVGAVLGYGYNGASDIPLDPGPLQTMRSFFEIRGIPHLMLWLDHPQWHADLVGLMPQMQGLFRSGSCIHLLKSNAHALEMERMVGWPNCFEFAGAVDPDQFPPSEAAEGRENSGDAPTPESASRTEFELVAICTERGELPPWMLEFVALDDPDPCAIRNIILEEVRHELDKLWKAEAPEAMRAELTALGIKWSGLKAAAPFLAAYRHWPILTTEFPGACWYLTLEYPRYMKAVRLLWRLREWERRFYLAYLAKYFRVGVFGGDWSPLKLGPGGWIDFRKQSETYARGRVALNITDGHDEEGLTLKPFEIAASGVAMLHYQAEGLADCFEPGREVEVFLRPREAHEKLEALLHDHGRRQAMAQAARTRVLRDHTWDRRIERMFTMARLPLDAFRSRPLPASAK